VSVFVCSELRIDRGDQMNAITEPDASFGVPRLAGGVITRPIPPVPLIDAVAVEGRIRPFRLILVPYCGLRAVACCHLIHCGAKI